MALPGATASSMEVIVLRSKDKLRIDERVEVRLAKALRARERRRVAAALAAATVAHATLVLFRFFRRVLFRKHLNMRLVRRREKLANRRWWQVNVRVSIRKLAACQKPRALVGVCVRVSLPWLLHEGPTHSVRAPCVVAQEATANAWAKLHPGSRISPDGFISVPSRAVATTGSSWVTFDKPLKYMVKVGAPCVW
jgi:hypothetical protein